MVRKNSKLITIYLLLTKSLLFKLKVIEGLNILKDSDKREKYNGDKKYFYFRCLGQDLINAGIKIDDLKIRFEYVYDIYIAEDNNTLVKLKNNPIFRAAECIGHIIPNAEKTEDTKASIFDKVNVKTQILYKPFEPHIEYTGYWSKIDINSAYPWAMAISNKYPNLTKRIINEYELKCNAKTADERQIHKDFLVALHGNLNRIYGDLKRLSGEAKEEDMYYKKDHQWYLQNIKFVDDYLESTKKILEDAGAEVVCKTVDSLIFRHPKDFEIPKNIKIGNKLGEYKLECYNQLGSILFRSPTGDSKISDIPGIKSTHNKEVSEEHYLLCEVLQKNSNNEMYINI